MKDHAFFPESTPGRVMAGGFPSASTPGGERWRWGLTTQPFSLHYNYLCRGHYMMYVSLCLLLHSRVQPGKEPTCPSPTHCTITPLKRMELNTKALKHKNNGLQIFDTAVDSDCANTWWVCFVLLRCQMEGNNSKKVFESNFWYYCNQQPNYLDYVWYPIDIVLYIQWKATQQFTHLNKPLKSQKQ